MASNYELRLNLDQLMVGKAGLPRSLVTDYFKYRSNHARVRSRASTRCFGSVTDVRDTQDVSRRHSCRSRDWAIATENKVDNSDAVAKNKKVFIRNLHIDKPFGL